MLLHSCWCTSLFGCVLGFWIQNSNLNSNSFVLRVIRKGERKIGKAKPGRIPFSRPSSQSRWPNPLPFLSSRAAQQSPVRPSFSHARPSLLRFLSRPALTLASAQSRLSPLRAQPASSLLFPPRPSARAQPLAQFFLGDRSLDLVFSVVFAF